MDPTERQRKITDIQNSPQVRALQARQREVIQQVLAETGRKTDEFLKNCVNLVFPPFVADAIERHSLDPRILKFTEELMQASLFSVERSRGVDRDSQVSNVFVLPERLLVGRMEILFEGGRLMLKVQLNETLRQPSGSLLDANNNRHVRVCLWHLCSANGLGAKSRRLYYLLYNKEPEATVDAIDSTCGAVPPAEDSASGVEQREPTDRG